jgi:predicted AlkP superfamily phosphohydrolase/phosphomutase
MTGANPAEHGIFGFTDVDPATLRLRFPAFSDLALPTFWDRLGESGLRCAIINQPATYPARPAPGVLVSGFVAPDLERSCWPQEHLPWLKETGYRVDVDTAHAQDRPEQFLDELQALLALRRRAIWHFWEQEDWDYFQVVLTGTDRLHHFLWKAVESSDHPLHERAVGFYQAVDSLVGEIWDAFCGRGGPAEGFCLLSDHGFTGVRWEVRLNAWLRERGYLSYLSEEPKSVAELGPGSRAFALDPGRIYLNARSRFRGGCVGPVEALALCDELTRRLLEFTWEGEKVIARVFTREEAFRGPRAGLAPDLVVLGNPGFDLKGTTQGREVVARSRFQGMHTWEDAFVWSALPVPDDPEIADLADVITRWLLG